MDSRLLRQLQRSLVRLISDQDTLAIKKILDERLSSDQQFSLDDDFVADTSCLDSQTYLQHAVRTGCLATVALFLDNGADVDARNRVGETTLYTACDYTPDSKDKVRLRVVEYLLKRGADVDAPNDIGWTPLMKACDQLNIPLVKLLLGAKANTDHTDCEGNSSLHLTLLASGPAAKIGSVVDLLARQDADVNQYNRKKMTPIMIASQQGWCNIIQTLLLAGSDLSCVDGEHSTCLSLAAQGQHADTVRLLLQNGTDPTITNYRWISPLLFAVMNLDEQTVGVILSTSQKTSTINLADCEGTTPMLYAVKEASQSAEGLYSVAGSIARQLLRYGCDVNTQHETNGDTPLILAARTACAELVKFLLENGADTNMADCCGETALHSCLDSSAADNSLLNLFRLLVASGSDVNLRNKNGLTALHKAAYKGCSVEVLKYLVEVGTELTGVSKDSNRYSILQSAVSSMAIDSALYLIDVGCDLNQQSATGETALSLSIRLELNQLTRKIISLPNCDLDAGGRNAPLHVATELGKEPIVVELLKRGADVNKRNGRGDTPLQIALDSHHLRIVRRLLSAGCTIEYQGLSPLSPLALLRSSFTPPDRQPLFLVVQHDDLQLFKQLLARYHRKPYHLLKTLHDMLTIDNEPSRRGNQMMSREGRRNLLSLLREELSSVPSLLEMCRGQLRKALGGKRADLRVNLLPLPLPLKHFVMYDVDRNLDLSDLDSNS